VLQPRRATAIGGSNPVGVGEPWTILASTARCQWVWRRFRDVTLRNGCADAWSSTGGSVPRCSLRGRSGARHARGAAARCAWLRVAAGGSAPPNPLRYAQRLGQRQVGTGKQARRSNRKAGLGSRREGQNPC